MAANDQILKLLVQVEAEVSQIKDVVDSLDKVKAKAKEINDESGKAAEGFRVTRQEAAALANELLRGELGARTLGQSMAEFGNFAAVGAIAIFTVIKGILEAQNAATKLREEAEKQGEALLTVAENWKRVADAVRSQSDLASLTREFGSSLDQINTKIADMVRQTAAVTDFRRGLQELFSTQQGVDWLKNLISPDVDKQLEQLKVIRAEMIRVQAQAEADANAHQAETAALSATKEGIADLTTKIIDLMEKQAALDTSTTAGQEAFIKYQEAIKNLEDQVRSTADAMKILDDQVKSLDADVSKQVAAGNKQLQEQYDIRVKIRDEAAVKNAAGNDEAVIEAKVKQVYDQQLAVLHAKGIFGDEAIRQANTLAEAERHELEVKAGQETAQSGLNALLQREQTLLEGIRQQQQLTQQKAFISVDQRDLELLRQYQQELQKVQQAMRDLAVKRGGLTDPAEIARADQEMQKLDFHAKQLALDISKAQHPLQAELQSWANSFGSVSTQIGHTIEATIGTALQSVNQFLVTGKFNAQQLLQSVIMLGLQLVEQVLIQQAMAVINNTLATTQAKIAGTAIATAMGPAATAATIATEGAAAAQAPFAIAGALAASMAVLLGGSTAHGGGLMRRRRMHGGGLAADEVPIIAQEGEIMIRRDVAQAPGMSDFLLGLNAGMFHSGGFVAGRSYHRGSDIENFYDLYGRFGPSVLATGGGPQFGGVSRFGGIDIPPADLSDPFADKFTSDFNQRVNLFDTRFWAGFGQSPSTGLAAFGNTAINTNWVNYPGVGLVPMAVPVTTDFSTIAGTRGLPPKQTTHSGGLISRMHSGGAVGGKGGGVHIYAFTDLRALTKHMGSKEGQKIIFDTVKGRRIDLGIS